MSAIEKPMADEQVPQSDPDLDADLDEDLEQAAEPGGGVPEFPVDPPDVPAPAP
jgi:hypothetical protein